MLITDGGKVIRTTVKGISLIGRNTQGVRLIELSEGEKVVGLARLAEDDAEAEDETAGEEAGVLPAGEGAVSPPDDEPEE